MNITIIGQVSAGKSSFINALYYMLLSSKKEWAPISTVSLQRETFNPIKYVFNGNKYIFNFVNCEINETDSYESIQNKNREIRKSGIFPEFKIIEKNINLPYNLPVASITDYCGFDDSKDNRNCLEYFLENMSGIIFYITPADRAFISKSEQEIYKKITDSAEKLRSAGTYVEIINIVSKFDYLDDKDLNEIFVDVPNPKYRWSSYGIIASAPPVKIYESEQRKARNIEVGDIDNLLEFILYYDYDKKIKEFELVYAKNNFNATAYSLAIKYNKYGYKRLCYYLENDCDIAGDITYKHINKWYIDFDKNKGINIYKLHKIFNLYEIENYYKFIKIFALFSVSSEFKKNIDLNIIRKFAILKGWQIIEIWHDYKYKDTEDNLFNILMRFNIAQPDINDILEWCYKNTDVILNENILCFEPEEKLKEKHIIYYNLNKIKYKALKKVININKKICHINISLVESKLLKENYITYNNKKYELENLTCDICKDIYMLINPNIMIHVEININNEFDINDYIYVKNVLKKYNKYIFISFTLNPYSNYINIYKINTKIGKIYYFTEDISKLKELIKKNI